MKYPRQLKGTRCFEYDPNGDFDRTVNGKNCRKLKISFSLNECLVEYEDGTKENVKIGRLRKKKQQASE